MNVFRVPEDGPLFDVRGTVSSMIRKADGSRGGKLVDIDVPVPQP